VAVFSSKSYDEQFLKKALNNKKEAKDITFDFFEPKLDRLSTKLLNQHEAVCVFVNDLVTKEVLSELKKAGVKLVILRSTGFDNVDLKAAEGLGIRVMRVSQYSPYAVAEHAVGLLLALNRKLPRSFIRVRDFNFSLEGLIGFDIHGKTVGILGTGAIGNAFATILNGFGTKLLGYDIIQNEELAKKTGLKYCDFDTVLRESDIISVHLPLTKDTQHIINSSAVEKMKDGVMIINTSRGELLNTKDMINGLKSGKIGYLGLDVYEGEKGIFFQDMSETIVQDDTLAELLVFPNVIVTGHQAFFTEEAQTQISSGVVQNVLDFLAAKENKNDLTPVKQK